MTKKTIEQRYKKLTPVEHVLKRPGRYLGSINNITRDAYVLRDKAFVKQETTWNPALLKMFDEVISNCADFAKTKDGKHLDTVRVDVYPMTGEISIQDNGGIPVELHKEYNEYVPEFIFGELRAGENFDDEEDSTSTGQNGEGAALVNIFSTEFKVDTSDGKKRFVQTYTENSTNKSKPSIRKASSKGTVITFTPDYAKLGTKLDQGNQDIIERRVYEIAATNPKLKVFLNGVLIKMKSFKDFVGMFGSDYVFETGDDFKVAISSSDTGFEHVSYVNSTHTATGGTHIDYVLSAIVSKIREHIKKKTKVDVRPSDIKNQIRLFVDATIINPRYSSQTKEDLITEVRDYKTSYTASDKFIAQVLKSTVIQNIMDWVAAKQYAEEQKALKQLNKNNDRANLKKIIKFEDATQRSNRHECAVFFAEGDSAAKPLISARTPETMGVFALKGKPLNVHDVDVKKLLKNEEFSNIAAILGLKIGVKATREQLRFGYIVVASDADLDGHHIAGLMYNMLYTFWPELFDMGVVYRLLTPIIKVTQGKKVLEFITSDEFNTWDAKNKKPYKADYIKGLGSNSTKDFERYLGDTKFLDPITIESDADRDAIDLAFNSKRADDRKEWLIEV